MFDGYTASELASIFVMQGFSGLCLFSVFLLMALGLAIIFGQMGVINMAHGEFMTLGAYMTYLTSTIFQKMLPGSYDAYFPVAILAAALAGAALGWLLEWALIRHLYRRPLDTLLATWGVSLILQQIYRSVFGAREVGVELPSWLMGAFHPTDIIELPINGAFIFAMTIVIFLALMMLMYRSRWGLQVRAVVQNRAMAGAAGINAARIDRMTFSLGCAVASIAGCAFTMIGSTGPTSGQLYIVKTFLVVVFGGAQSLFGTVASAFTIAQSQSTLEFFTSGSMATVITLVAVVGILLVRPQGLFVLKMRR